MNSSQDPVWWLSHLASLGAIAAAFAGIIPSLAAIIAILWYAILIWESATAKAWRTRRNAVKLVKLRAKERLLLARIKEAESSPKATPEDPA